MALPAIGGIGAFFGMAAAAFNPATLFATAVTTFATAAVQKGANELAGRAGGGFFGDLASSFLNPMSSTFTNFMQKWLGGVERSSGK